MPTLNEYIRNFRSSIHLHRRHRNESIQLMGEVDPIRGGGNIVKRVRISEILEHPRVDMTISMRNSPEISDLARTGDMITYRREELRQDFTTRFVRDGIFTILRVKDSEDSYTKDLICRNFGHQLMRRPYNIKLNKDETTGAFIYRTATEKGVPIESTIATTYQHQAKVFMDKSLFDMWHELLQLESVKESVKYNIRFGGAGGLVFERVEPQTTSWVFEASEDALNMLDPRRDLSIMENSFFNVAIAINRAEAVGQYDFIAALAATPESSNLDLPEVVEQARNVESVIRHGEYPIYIDTTSYGKPEEVRDKLQYLVDLASQPLDNINFRTYAINSIRPGDIITIMYPNMGSVGEYFIDSLTTIIEERRIWHDVKAIKYRDLSADLIAELSRGDSSSEPAGFLETYGSVIQ